MSLWTRDYITLYERLLRGQYNEAIEHAILSVDELRHTSWLFPGRDMDDGARMEIVFLWYVKAL